MNLTYPPRRLVEYQGQMLPLAVVAKAVGMSSGVLWCRVVRDGMTLADAIAKPIRPRAKQ